MPSLREFRFELFEHGNILWSNLRALGQPMLGNGVQAAPLFPLTLILIGLPDQFFWSVMPIIRVLLIALGCFVLARKAFGLSFSASFAFAILAGFNLNVFRWINHPWSNGILAGLWYLVFLHRVSFVQSLSLKSQRLARLGLIVAVYSMVTCGFPEAAAVSALLVLVLFTALVVANATAFGESWRSISHDIVMCHIAGFAFSAPQVFALLEYIEFTGAMSLRDSFIDATYRPDEVLPYWLSQLTLLWESDVQHRYLNFSIGLLGLVLACKGVVVWVMCYRNHPASIRSVGFGFLLLMMVFVAKSFGLFAPLAWVFAHTPVLAQSHFPLYFSPLFYFGLAFFAAIGFNSYTSDLFIHLWQRVLDLLLTGVAIVLSIRLLELSVEQFNNINRQNFWIMQERGDGAGFIWLFIGLSILLLTWQLLSLSRSFRQVIAMRSALISSVMALLLLGALIYEVADTQRDRFANADSASLFIPEKAKLAVQHALQELPVARHELRNNDHSGRFIELGIASIDNGISAMLPPNSRRVRRALYHTQYGGYYPLGGEKARAAGALLTNNIQIVPPQPAPPPDWSNYQLGDSSGIQFLDWERDIEHMRDNPWVLKGVILTQGGDVGVNVWVQLKGGQQLLWLKADQINLSQDKKTETPYLTWTVRIPTQWLDETHYEFVLRVVDDNTGLYHDSGKEALVVHKPYPFSQTSRSFAVSERLNSYSLSAQEQASQWHLSFDRTALPRAFIASGCQRFSDEAAASAFLAETSNSLRGEIALLVNGRDHQSKPEVDFCDDYSGLFEGVSIMSDVGSKLELDSVQGPSLLYLNDTFYPGWQAHDRTTGQTLNIEPANLGMRAVYLAEERDYDIVFHYQPAWLIWAYLLLFLALIVSAYMLLVLPVRVALDNSVNTR